MILKSAGSVLHYAYWMNEIFVQISGYLCSRISQQQTSKDAVDGGKTKEHILSEILFVSKITLNNKPTTFPIVFMFFFFPLV